MLTTLFTRIGSFVRHNARRSSPNHKFEPDLNSLFRFTSGHWLCNDKENKEAGSLTFNVGAFCKLAADAVGARAVTDMVKINESTNRVFLVRFDTGREAVARFPTSIAGPPHFATASEVATMDFLRSQLGFPIPPVLAWSSRAESTDVGAEFILMEKVTGCLLTNHWEGLPSKPRAMFAPAVGKFKRQLLQLQFTHYGSLYYKKDVPTALRAPTLLEGITPEDELNSIFCIGPIARREFWEAERADMDIDRGPWQTTKDYMTAVVRREQEWISRFGTPHILDDWGRVLPGQGDRDDHVSWLSKYTTLIPSLIPLLDEQTRPVMWHPDLHDGNIFVKPSGDEGKISPAIPLEISSIIDWQGTWIGPAFLQIQVPPLFRTQGAPPGRQVPVRPDNFEELDESEKAEISDTHQRLVRHKLFEACVFPPSILDMTGHQERCELEALSQATWKFGLIPFKMSILYISQNWGDISPGHTCPVQFSAKDLEDLKAHYTIWSRNQQFAEDLDREFGLGDYGYVKGDRDHFAQVQSALERKKSEYIDQGGDEEAKRISSLWWPYRDTLRDHEVIPRSSLPSVHDGTA